MGGEGGAVQSSSVVQGVKSQLCSVFNYVQFIVISQVEEGDIGFVVQAWAVLWVLDLSLQLHHLLCCGVLKGGREADLIEIFGEGQARL